MGLLGISRAAGGTRTGLREIRGGVEIVARGGGHAVRRAGAAEGVLD